MNAETTGTASTGRARRRLGLLGLLGLLLATAAPARADTCTPPWAIFSPGGEYYGEYDSSFSSRTHAPSRKSLLG